MPNARIVVAQGTIDGANTVFACGEPYVPGSAAYILNGRIHNAQAARGPENAFGFFELSPDSGTIQVDNPPLVGDVVQIFFWDRKVVPAPAVTQLTGTVASGQRIQGSVRPVEPEQLTGVVASQPLRGTIREVEPERLTGTVRPSRLVGTIRERCP